MDKPQDTFTLMSPNDKGLILIVKRYKIGAHYVAKLRLGENGPVHFEKVSKPELMALSPEACKLLANARAERLYK